MRRLDAALSNDPLKICDKPGTRQSPAACQSRRSLTPQSKIILDRVRKSAK
ncbi:MAG: hypothetical protein IJG38_02835 [Thermoguttaceae bacterium]|nr:hypothetical protein [Thermoguttaceae bacterium]